MFISAGLIFTVIFCPQTSELGSQHSSFVKDRQGGTSEKDHFYSKMTGAGLPSHVVTDRKPSARSAHSFGGSHPEPPFKGLKRTSTCLGGRNRGQSMAMYERFTANKFLALE